MTWWTSSSSTRSASIPRSSCRRGGTHATTTEGLTAARAAIAERGDVAFEADELEPVLRDLAAGRGWKAGDLFMAIRVAITGKTATPPLFDTMVALGRERTLERLARRDRGPAGGRVALGPSVWRSRSRPGRPGAAGWE